MRGVCLLCCCGDLGVVCVCLVYSVCVVLGGWLVVGVWFVVVSRWLSGGLVCGYCVCG